MFTQPCFIRKNTPELRKKLESIGLKLMNPDDTTLDAHNYDGKGNHKKICEGNAIITYRSSHYGVIYCIDDVTKKDRIDCGKNEELFLAIAALRDDTDKNQWFVYDNSDLADEEEICRFFFICEDDDIKTFMNLDVMYTDCHKATVNELIEHFKDK